MDLGMRSTSHYDSMPCMTVASLEMSDEPKKRGRWGNKRPLGLSGKRQTPLSLSSSYFHKREDENINLLL